MMAVRMNAYIVVQLDDPDDYRLLKKVKRHTEAELDEIMREIIREVAARVEEAGCQTCAQAAAGG
jgi:hypothetical protein